MNSTLSIHFMLSFKPFVTRYLCLRCEKLFQPMLSEKYCFQCGRIQSINELCEDCLKWNQVKSFKLINQSLYSYDGVIKEYIDRYKFQGDYRLRKLVATQITELIKKYEVVVPIPINQVTMGVRKFNQVTGWLEEVNYTMALTAKPKLKAQFQKNRSERLQTQQPFAMNEKYVEMIKQKQICLVDDIYTTGTTLHHAAQLLLDNGAQSVRSITLAR